MFHFPFVSSLRNRRARPRRCRSVCSRSTHFAVSSPPTTCHSFSSATSCRCCTRWPCSRPHLVRLSSCAINGRIPEQRYFLQPLMYPLVFGVVFFVSFFAASRIHEARVCEKQKQKNAPCVEAVEGVCTGTRALPPRCVGCEHEMGFVMSSSSSREIFNVCRVCPEQRKGLLVDVIKCAELYVGDAYGICPSSSRRNFVAWLFVLCGDSSSRSAGVLTSITHASSYVTHAQF